MRTLDTVSIIAESISHYALGDLTEPPHPISSGLTNQVFQLATTNGRFVIKIVNKSSPRARSMANYRDIERLQKYFYSAHHLPVVLARTIASEPVYESNNAFVLIYPFVDGKPLGGPIGPVAANHAHKAGQLLGTIHKRQASESVKLDNIFAPTFEHSYTVNLQKVATLIQQYQNMDDLLIIAQKTQAAYQRSHARMVYSHGDYQPHNILANGDELTIIDWELAGLINPGMEFVIALITFSGLATEGQYNADALQAFMDGYRRVAGCQIQDDLDDAIGAALHKCWINWIVFNMEIDNRAQATEAYGSLKCMLAKRGDLKQSIINYVPDPPSCSYSQTQFNNT